MAEAEVQLEEAQDAPVVIELDIHEIGRTLLVHRRRRFRLPMPAVKRAGAGLNR